MNQPTHSPATAFCVRVALKHISAEVLGMRMIDGVHADCGRAMVFCDSYCADEAHL